MNSLNILNMMAVAERLFRQLLHVQLGGPHCQGLSGGVITILSGHNGFVCYLVLRQLLYVKYHVAAPKQREYFLTQLQLRTIHILNIHPTTRGVHTLRGCEILCRDCLAIFVLAHDLCTVYTPPISHRTMLIACPLSTSISACRHTLGHSPVVSLRQSSAYI